MARAPQQQRSRERLERVLDAAEELLAQDGAEGFAIRPLAARAGVSVGWLYGFLDDRDALLEAVALRGLADLDEALQEAAGAHPQDAVALAEAAVDATVAWCRRRPGARLALLDRRAAAAVRGADARQNERLAALLSERGVPEVRAAVAVEAAEAAITLAFARDPAGDPAVLAEARALMARALGDDG